MLGLVEMGAPHWDEVYYVINFHTLADMNQADWLDLLLCSLLSHHGSVDVSIYP